jgi:mannan endo-1,4-beta-mannosidase
MRLVLILLTGCSSEPMLSSSQSDAADPFDLSVLDSSNVDSSNVDSSNVDSSNVDSSNVDAANVDSSSADLRAHTAGATFTVSGNQILDPCGQKFVARGINHPTLYVDRAGAAIPEIAKTGANVVRLFWFAGNGVAISEAEDAIKACADAGMVAMLEMHDSTCGWNLDTIQAYWTSAEAVALIKKYQRNFWLNIANETSPPNGGAYVSKYTTIVQAIRAAGIDVPLVIDAGGCGRDSNLLLDNGAALTAADPKHNLIFSWHFYDPLTKPQITAVLQKSIDKNLPFIVGEYANKEPPGCGAALDYKFMIGEAQRLGLGWLAWSWGDNDTNSWWNGDCNEFDMTRTFAFSTLERWGLEVAVSDGNSIQKTASLAHGLGGMCP